MGTPGEWAGVLRICGLPAWLPRPTSTTSPAGCSSEESPEALRTFEEFVERKGLNKTEMVSPSHVGKSRIPPLFPSWLGPEAWPRGAPRVCVFRQACSKRPRGHICLCSRLCWRTLAPDPSDVTERCPPGPGSHPVLPQPMPPSRGRRTHF